MGDVTINGKRVTFRERLPLKDGARLPKLATAVDEQDMDTWIPVFQVLIESWEHPGDPSQVASYQELDIWRDIIPLYKAMNQEVAARLADMSPKALASASSSV